MAAAASFSPYEKSYRNIAMLIIIIWAAWSITPKKPDVKIIISKVPQSIIPENINGIEIQTSSHSPYKLLESGQMHALLTSESLLLKIIRRIKTILFVKVPAIPIP
jgi:hypothetical protein